jgi:hypothetical protein
MRPLPRGSCHAMGERYHVLIPRCIINGRSGSKPVMLQSTCFPVCPRKMGSRAAISRLTASPSAAAASVSMNWRSIPTSRPDLGEQWPSRLVATAAEERLKHRAQICTHRLRRPAMGPGTLLVGINLLPLVHPLESNSCGNRLRLSLVQVARVQIEDAVLVNQFSYMTIADRHG